MVSSPNLTGSSSSSPKSAKVTLPGGGASSAPITKPIFLLLLPELVLLHELDLRRLLDEGNFRALLPVVDPGDDGGMDGTLVLIFAINEPVMGLGGKWNETDPIDGDIFVLLALAAMAEA